MPVDMSRDIKVLRVCERNLRAVVAQYPQIGSPTPALPPSSGL